MNRTQPSHGGATLAVAALLVAALAAIALPGPALAETHGARGPLAVTTVHAGGVDFLPNVAFSGAKITVAGRDLVYERSFGAGDRLSIGLFDPDDQLLADGIYKWRLSLTPAAREARELRRAAELNGGIAPDPWRSLSGSFAIRNGLMADPSLAESRPARSATIGSALPTNLSGASRGKVSSDTADDGDAAVAAGRTVVSRTVATAGGGRPNLERSDATTAAADPVPAQRALKDDSPTHRRSYPTDGKNGRD